jgi:hypothetical protein
MPRYNVRDATIRKVENGYLVELTETTGFTNEINTRQVVFRNWTETMICVSEFMGEYEGD